MPFIAPVLLSILTHVVFGLSTALVTIMSMWTQRRVGLASSFTSAFEEETPSFVKPRSTSFRKRRPAPIVFQDFNFGVPLQRSLSVGSSPLVKHECPPSPKCRPYRIPSSPLVTSPVITATEKGDLELLPPISLGEKRSNVWMDSSASVPTSPAASVCEDYFSYEPNSPTGSLLDGSCSNVPFWADSQSPLEGERRSAGRKIIIALCFLRIWVTLPLIWLEGNLGHFSMPRLFIASEDLLLLDCSASTILLLYPLFCVIGNCSLTLPKSFEHHIYHATLILLLLPLLATFQLFNNEFTSIYRFGGLGVGAVTLLVARDQAQASYWAPLTEKKNRTKWAY
ncbi:hypothetical protein QFC21_005980 [Naganishia friedmannii]|uniref:Uncharacterized protein n=1 Tax=Naganishia friedmannii TaxID=89922 RepID=A0ACC2V6F5_9TREE|nr:hypothetical protein QFC21_005980 [Naganishia friedmannii]